VTFGRNDTDCHTDNGKIAHVFADKFRSMYIMILLAIFLLHRNNADYVQKVLDSKGFEYKYCVSRIEVALAMCC